MLLLKLIVSSSGAADHLFDPTCESGDASVNAVEVWTAAPFAPADHPSKEPAAWRLLANQGPAWVSLTGKVNLLHLSWIWKYVVQFVFAVPDRHLFLHCGNQRKAFWEWPCGRRNECRLPRSPGGRPPSEGHYWPYLRSVEEQVSVWGHTHQFIKPKDKSSDRLLSHQKVTSKTEEGPFPTWPHKLKCWI